MQHFPALRVVLFLSITSCAAPNAARTAPVEKSCAKPLIVRTRIRPHDVRAYPAAEAPAQRPDGAPVLDVPSFQGAPLWSPAKNQAKGVVLPAAFPDGLDTVNAVRFGVCSLWPGDHARIGRISPAAYAELGPVELTRFLIVTDTIRTFLHVDAELCLDGPVREGERDIVRVTGIHHYCGNECTEDDVRFSVSVDARGVIFVSSNERGARPKDLESLRAKGRCPDIGR